MPESLRRPNVVLLYTDQQRWDTLGSLGNERIHTPNLDALAARGAAFPRAFCNSPVCMPSRHSMLSGQYPSAIGSTCNGIEMPQDVLTVQRVLGTYGYYTANIGKLHFKNHSARDHRGLHPDYGFDELVLSDEPGCYDDAYIKWVAQKDPAQVENCRCTSPPAAFQGRFGPPWETHEKHPRRTHEPYVFEGPEDLTHTAFVAEETAGLIRRRAGRGPFFVIGGFYAPHAPINPPARFVDLYDPDEMPPPAMNERERERFGLSDAEWRRVRAYYYALVSHIDDQVGRVLDALEETGVAEETIVIFTSDHGEHLGDHGAVGKGPPGYDSSARVPLIVSYPAGIPASARPGQIVEHVDVVPTILDCCGVQVPPRMQGRSFRPLLAGGDYTPRRSAFIEHRVPHGASWKAVRTDRHLYATRNGEHEVLFDVEADPHQLTDLSEAPAHRETLEGMRRELLRRWFDVEPHGRERTAQY